VDAAIAWLKGQDPRLQVADFGCGDARLAASVPQKVHSLDLVAAAPGVIACNMADTPLGEPLHPLRLAAASALGAAASPVVICHVLNTFYVKNPKAPQNERSLWGICAFCKRKGEIRHSVCLHMH
jgi:hypothetical protein